MGATVRRTALWSVLLAAMIGCTALGTSDQRGRLSDGGDVVDVAMDSGVDVGADALVDSAVDIGTDMAADSGVDVAMDAGTDSGIDVVVDAGADSGTDAMPMCPSGQTMCSDGCVDLTSSTTNCGLCGNACPSRAHATAACTGGTCGFVCTAGFADCDGVAANGCEANLSTDAAHCGTCGHACSFANAVATCEGAGNCGFTCMTGFANCDGVAANGCESSTAADANNCGGCGSVCAAGSVCGEGACTPGPPQQIAPLSTATVTTQMPTLHWQLAPRATGAHVDVCANRAMTVNCVSHDVTGPSLTMPSSLTAGAHFWRVFGIAVGVTGAVPSPTWEFFVGHRSAPVDASWGTVADFNGDGYADVVVGATYAPIDAMGDPGTGEVYVFPGAGGGLSTSPSVTLPAPDGVSDDRFGWPAGCAGDVNGDGYADLVVGAQGVMANTGAAYVFLGSAAGVAAVPSTTLIGPIMGNGFGISVAGAGDVNGDGYADVVVGSGSGGVSTFLGSATGLQTTPTVVLSSAVGIAGIQFGWCVASAGDVNGDGYADVAVGDGGAASFSGRAYIYNGSAAGLSSTPSITLAGVDGANASFGASVASAGDVNGDGFADLVVGAFTAPYMAGSGNGPGRTYVFTGSATGILTTPAIVLTGPGEDSGRFGISVAGVGDANGDGYADVVVGAEVAGLTYVFWGGASGISAAPFTTLVGPDGVASGFGYSVAGAGDVDGDAIADLVIGTPFPVSDTGRVYFYLGGSLGLGSSPTTTLISPDRMESDEFGASVASAGHFHSADRFAVPRFLDGRLDSAWFAAADLVGLAARPSRLGEWRGERDISAFPAPPARGQRDDHRRRAAL